MTRSYERTFDDLLPETIENILKQVLGEVSAKVVLQYIKKSDSLNREVFVDDLHKILGQGSVIIEDLILESLYSKLKLRFDEKEGYRFSDYIKELREGFER